MSEDKALAVQQPAPVVSESLVSILSRMSTNPNFNADAFRELISAAERERLDQRKAEFAASLHAIQSMRLRVVKSKNAKNSKYAPLEDVDALLAPHLKEHGLTNSFDSPDGVSANGMMNMVVYIYHVNGYREQRSLPMPVDDIGLSNQGKRMRPACQDHASTVSYSRRQLLKMAYNVIEVDEDDDGEQGESSSPISQEQADTLRDKCTEYGFTSDDKRRVGHFASQLGKLDPAKFSVDQIRKCDYAAVMTLIEEMKR